MPKPGEQPLFEEPKFDEKEYLQSEMQRAKGIIFVFLLGAATGAAAGYLQLAGLWYVAVIIMFIFLIFLGKILRFLRVKTPTKVSHKFLNGAIYFFSWLLFWIVVLNVPIHSVSMPELTGMHGAPVGTNNWTSVSLSSGNVFTVPSSLIGDSEYNLSFVYRSNITITGLQYTLSTSTSWTSISYHEINYREIIFNFTGKVNTDYNFRMYWENHGLNQSTPIDFYMDF
jgi:hypothetical protein